MKRKLIHAAACLLFIQGSFAQSGDNLTTVPHYAYQAAPTQTGFTTSANHTVTTDRGLELSKAMTVSLQKGSIITPGLQVGDQLNLSFNYSVTSAATGAIDICLADANNKIIRIADHITTDRLSTNDIYSYHKSLPVASGSYRLYIRYQGDAAVAINNLATNAAQVYASGENTAPVAVADQVTAVTGDIVTGNVLTNDYDKDRESLTAYLINPSPDGKVVLSKDGSYTFTPKEGFTGSHTSFTYQVCDAGFGTLCSTPVKVTITFTSPAALVDFKGLYRDGGDVELNWETSSEQSSVAFEVERSIDGMQWETVGKVEAKGNASSGHTYSFTDEVSRRMINKNDLYYRLKETNADNKAYYTKLLVVRVYNTRTLKTVSVTPNPAKNDIAVNLQLKEDAYVVMKVHTVGGTEVMRKSVKADAGSNTFLLDDSSQLSPGMYLLEVVVNSKDRMILKLVKE